MPARALSARDAAETAVMGRSGRGMDGGRIVPNVNRAAPGWVDISGRPLGGRAPAGTGLLYPPAGRNSSSLGEGPAGVGGPVQPPDHDAGGGPDELAGVLADGLVQGALDDVRLAGPRDQEHDLLGVVDERQGHGYPLR